MMASGVYACCIDRGIAVGRDIALFGYDNLNIVEAYVPPISSVEPAFAGNGLQKRRADFGPNPQPGAIAHHGPLPGLHRLCPWLRLRSAACR